MRTIAVIGAGGRTGRCLLSAARAQGWEVNALARRPGSLPEPRPGLRTVYGDGRDAAAVRTAVGGADAVISVVSGGTKRDPARSTDVVRTVIAEMRRAGLGRLVVTSAYPVVGVEPRVPMAILRRVFRHAYADVRNTEAVVEASPLRWTIVRLNRLTDGPVTGQLDVRPGLLPDPRGLSRADAAAVLLQLVGDAAAEGMALNVSGA